MKLGTFLKALIGTIYATSIPAFSQNDGPAPSQKILAGYYPDWEVRNYTVEMVPYQKLTHVIWSFVTPDTQGNLRGDAIKDPTQLDKMVELAHAAGVKAILSLGGANQCENFAPVSKDNALREKFVKELAEFVQSHDLDGIDMDWEYSKVPVASEDTAGYNQLLKDIRAALPKGKTLSAALPCSDYYGKFFTADVLLENLDWLGLMTYDITGDWDDKARFDSPLFPNTNGSRTTWSWKQAGDYWSKRGIPAEKLVFGVPTFGFIFYESAGPGTTFFKGMTEYDSYSNIIKNNDWQFLYDDVAKEPYALGNDIFVTYEDAKSSIDKTNWINENGYAGAMVWELTMDYLGNGDQPIVNTLSSVLLEGTIPESTGKKTVLPTFNSRQSGKYTYDALGHHIRIKASIGRYYNR